MLMSGDLVRTCANVCLPVAFQVASRSRSELSLDWHHYQTETGSAATHSKVFGSGLHSPPPRPHSGLSEIPNVPARTRQESRSTTARALLWPLCRHSLLWAFVPFQCKICHSLMISPLSSIGLLSEKSSSEAHKKGECFHGRGGRGKLDRRNGQRQGGECKG